MSNVPNQTMLNVSNASCSENPESDTEQAMRYLIAVCLALIIVVSIIGNLMVCIAFKVNENLRIVSNYFILSLAVSDLITTIFVMPYDLDIMLSSSWKHGERLCQFYTTVYLVSAPASTMNLLAVSIDRFRLIRDPFAYKRTTTPLRAVAMITGIWVYSTVMAFLPLMGWKDENPIANCTSPMCQFDIAWDYSIMMSVLNFVIPPLIMTVIYFKIYQIARSHIRRIHRLESITGAANGRNSLSGMINTSNSRKSSINAPNSRRSSINAPNSRRSSINAPNNRRSSRASTCSPIQLETDCNGTHHLTVPHANHKLAHERRDSAHATLNNGNVNVDIAHTKMNSVHVKMDLANANVDNAHASKEHADINSDYTNANVVPRANGKRKSRTFSMSGTSMLRKNVKAAKSLAIIVGTFFLCWYPFTILSMVLNTCLRSELCDHYALAVPPYLANMLLIFGFLNSMLNPFLYGLHNKEFKRTYKRILRLK